MKKFFLLFAAIPLFLSAQTYMPITDNMVIGSNSNIKFAAGDYIFPDPGLDGVIQIDGKHDIKLDGDSCTVNGTNYNGYMIKITNSHNIVIKNFDSVFAYKYAVYILNSDHIVINGNDFSRNKVDSIGWIDVWSDYTQALGGGVMMYQSRSAHIYDNIMKYQNDGVALYHCDSILIHNNDFAWNTSYGIRMFWTDSCNIYENTASHINRPYTDPSDCAALLMIISNENRVVNNDLTWSGDGVFLGQYQHSDIPNNNYFAYNECSHSPHNAIEATFADGNVYKHNICNFSDYGFWLGYSFNSIVDSNEVIGNTHSGIAIDRGFSNIITNCHIKQNPIGIELWQGSPIGGYESQTSHDYDISYDTIEGNSIGISATTTMHAVITGNTFPYNQAQSVYLSGVSPDDTITQNDFRMPTAQHIKNNSVNDVWALNNVFEPSDTSLISLKIYDKSDNSAKGRVYWYPDLPGPPVEYQYQPPCDMAEPASIWYAYPEAGYGSRIDETVTFDTTEKAVGYASVKLVTGRGWDVALNYRPALDSVSLWNLTDNDTLYFWVRTIKQPQYGFQYFHIRIGDMAGNYYRYTASPSLLNAANLTWKQYSFPLSGNSQFVRSMTGTMDLANANYFEIHADTWDYGYTLWVDGVQFSLCTPTTGIPGPQTEQQPSLSCFPNPFSGITNIQYQVPQNGKVTIDLYDFQGKLIRTLLDRNMQKGNYSLELSSAGLKPGMYLVKMNSGSESFISKLVLIR